jgi:hypothetical protein
MTDIRRPIDMPLVVDDLEELLLVRRGPDDERWGAVIGTVRPASYDAVVQVLLTTADDDDGRSPYMWVRLANGDLILGVFPRGATYTSIEEEAP